MLRILKHYYPIRNLFFILGESVIIIISVYLASLIMLWGKMPLIDNGALALKIILIGIICQGCLYYNGLYDLTSITSYTELSIRLFQSLGASSIFLAIIYFFSPGAIIGNGIFALSITFVIISILTWRYGYTLVLNRGLFNQKIIMVGSGELALSIITEIHDKKDCGYTLGVVVKEPGENSICADNLSCNEKVLQKTDYEGLCEMAKELGIKKIVVALREKRGNFPTKELLKCRMEGIEILDGNTFFEMLTGKLIVEQINPAWLIFSNGFKTSASSSFTKRVVDIFFSILLLAVTLPILILVAFLIKLDSKGPVFFGQERVGRNRKPYRIYKFRSMISDAESKSGPVWAKTEDDRITRVGHFIRKWRIDELPQLWNVLRGDMSFIGPRPEREHFVKQLEKVIPYYIERLSVKPGVTGWAQVSYGYGASVEDAVEKLNYDMFYIKNISIFMDILIIFKTVKTVLFGEGAR
ncbi:MAG: TIGR03013 family PEP-CTERM/XrtA system glycosyltransferase [Desulfobacterales bacterium]|nr:TIGR03013 family PEP-CTERM/XrtA system glycosyltransferase [Desulfobacterales bacterium]